jgi:TetR/AcrR family transcriptional regulator, fatty acid metabolism regulator protein
MLELSDRKIQIIKAGLDIISKKGIQKLSIRNIAKHINVTEPAIYRHFKSKRDIVLHIAMYIFSNWEEFLKLLEYKNKSAFEQLEYAFKKTIKYIAENEEISATLYSLRIYQDDKKLLKKILGIIDIMVNTISQLLTKGQEEGSVRKDVTSLNLANLIVGGLRILMEKWNLGGSRLDLIKTCDELWSDIRKMIVA